MQSFEHAYSIAQLNMSLVMQSDQSLILRDNDTGTLENWIPFAQGLVIYNGQRYGYSADRTFALPSNSN